MRMSSWIGVGVAVGFCGLWSGEVAPAQESTSRPESAPTPESQPARQEPPPATGFLYKTVEFEGRNYAYCVYVPPEYTPEQAWPVILFLHGSRAVGDDGFLQTDHGIAWTIRRKRKLCPAIVVMPQSRPGKWWADEMLEMALRCVEDTSGEYRCDPERVYLTGLSMGGAGTWLLGSRMPNAFAALVPISGFYKRPDVAPRPGEVAAAAAKLARLPIWCFHGAADTNVPVQRSRELVAAVRAAGGEVKYTELAEAKHDVWKRAYDNPAVWRWLLAQRRQARSEERQ